MMKRCQTLQLQGSPRRWFGENASLLISAINVREVGCQRQLTEHFFKIYKLNNQPFQKQQGISIYLERRCEMQGAFPFRLVMPK